jgi:hypothetical protein
VVFHDDERAGKKRVEEKSVARAGYLGDALESLGLRDKMYEHAHVIAKEANW